MRRVPLLRPTLLLLLAGALAACARAPQPDAVYAPTRSVLEVVSLLRLHVDDDTYRFPAARDLTGKDVYRTSLQRLEDLEQIHARKLASGYMLDVIHFSKARALERLGEFELATRHYERVAGLESPLAAEAARSAQVCAELHAAGQLTPGPVDDPEAALGVLDEREARIAALREAIAGTHHAHVVEEELERTDRLRADYFAARSALDPRLDAFALRLRQEVVQRHRDSKLQVRHLLALADFYAELAERYARRAPPHGLEFDAAIFDEYAFGATRIYETVSHRDGRVEKLEAARKLEAFLAFTLQVYDDRLPQ